MTFSWMVWPLFTMVSAGKLAQAPCSGESCALTGLIDIERGLLRARGAGAVGGIEVAPFLRPEATLVAPMRVCPERRRCAERAERKSGE